MKKVILLFALFILGISLNAQSFNFIQSEFVEKEYLIELPYKKISGKIIIDVQIDDRVLKFVLDTGAPTALRKELSEDLGFEVLSSEDMTDVNGNKNAFKIVRIDRLKLAESSVINIPAVVFEENLITECLKVDGLIGSNLLHNSVIQFDDKNKMVRISNVVDNLEVLNAKSADILIDKQSSPILRIQIGENATEELLFDTGDDCLYTMSNTNMKKLKSTKTFSTLSKSIGTTSVGINGLEEQSKKYRILIPELMVQGLILENIVSETTTDNNSRVGCRLLQHGVFTIDYKNSKSYFESYLNSTDIEKTFWSISPVFIDDKLVVGRIWTKSIKNISVGDRIVSINNINSESASACEFFLNSPLSELESATLGIRNSKGDVSHVEIKKID